MSKKVKQMKDALCQLMIEEIFAEMDKNNEDTIELEFNYGNVHFIDLNAEYDDNGKCTDIFINIQYEEDGLLYHTESSLWDLDLSELNWVHKNIVGE